MATRPNLRDVARAAGVSTATASRALNPEGHVGPDLRHRVRAAAKRLRYVPNVAGRSLVSGATPIVAVLLGEERMSDSVAQILAGMERELSANDCGLLYAVAGSDHGRLIEGALRRGAKAVICLDAPDALTTAAGLSNLPVVSIRSGWSGTRTDISSERPQNVAALGFAYLRSLGHQRLAMIVSPEFADALSGYDDLAGGSGVRLVRADSGAGGAGAKAMESLLREQPRPTAVLCSDDALAAGALAASYRSGVRVPEDLSLLGCGDSPLARATLPALSSLRICWDEVGKAAARRALVAFDGGQKTMNPNPKRGLRIVVRGSTQCLVPRETNVPRETAADRTSFPAVQRTDPV